MKSLCYPNRRTAAILSWERAGRGSYHGHSFAMLRTDSARARTTGILPVLGHGQDGHGTLGTPGIGTACI